jgi:hypothetical protein
MFFGALWSGNTELLPGVLHKDAVLRDADSEYRGRAVEAWALAHASERRPGGRIVNRQWVGGSLVVTVLSDGGLGGPGSELFDWHLQIDNNRIVRLSIERHRSPALPNPVDRFLKAVNEGDLASIMETFGEDALVNDELIDYWGQEKIRRWAERDVVGKRLALLVVGSVERDHRTIVTCHATGDFDGLGLPDPLVLSLYLSVSNNRIVQLIILQKPPAD